MKITLITAVYNNVGGIRETLESVISQNIPNLEYIVIDGGSTDGTLEIIQEYKSNISILVSEKDSGIYHALNKGITLASGEIVGILHSGDFFSNEKILGIIQKKFEISNLDLLYGDLCYVDKKRTDKIIRNWISGPFTKKRLSLGWHPPHPTLYLKRNIFNRVGIFNLDYKICSDYDFMVRVFKLTNLKIGYLPKVILKMRTGGASNNSFLNFWKKSKEDARIIRENQVGGIHTLVFKKLSKLSQFF